MIADAILWFVGRMLKALLDTVDAMIPYDWDVTGFAESAAGGIQWAVTGLASLSVWVPVQMIITMAGLLISAKLIGLLIHVLRIGMSLITGGGGAT